jgi:hypothetical protein
MTPSYINNEKEEYESPAVTCCVILLEQVIADSQFAPATPPDEGWGDDQGGDSEDEW